jgi:hypothetical protein
MELVIDKSLISQLSRFVKGSAQGGQLNKKGALALLEIIGYYEEAKLNEIPQKRVRKAKSSN